MAVRNKEQQGQRRHAASRAIDRLLRDEGIAEHFPESVERDAERAAVAKRSGHRDDHSQRAFVTIDPEDARDHDDAVWCEKNPAGWRLEVAIADVADKIVPGSRLQRAAKARGESVYLPDRVVPMCPRALSEDACSLHEGEERAVLWTRIQVSRDGRTQAEPGEVMRPSRIRVAAGLSYEHAMQALGGAPKDAVQRSILALRECGQALAKARDERGAIHFTVNEEVICRRTPEGIPTWPVRRTALETHRMIEEAMIAHNRIAAHWLAEHARARGAVHRVHGAPHATDWTKAMALARDLGLIDSEDAGKRETLHTMLMEGHKHKRARWAELAARIALPKAEYAWNPEGHFALALEHYAHSTSPIRRYADLENQRAAHAWHRGDKSELKGQTAGLCEQLNATERKTVEIERKATKIWIAHAMAANRPRGWLDGTIVGVQPFGIFVEPDIAPGAEAMCHVSALGEGWYEATGSATLTGQEGEQWRLGDRITMRYRRIDIRNARMDADVRKEGRG